MTLPGRVSGLFGGMLLSSYSHTILWDFAHSDFKTINFPWAYNGMSLFSLAFLNSGASLFIAFLGMLILFWDPVSRSPRCPWTCCSRGWPWTSAPSAPPFQVLGLCQAHAQILLPKLEAPLGKLLQSLSRAEPCWRTCVIGVRFEFL